MPRVAEPAGALAEGAVQRRLASARTPRSLRRRAPQTRFSDPPTLGFWKEYAPENVPQLSTYASMPVFFSDEELRMLDYDPGSHVCPPRPTRLPRALRRADARQADIVETREGYRREFEVFSRAVGEIRRVPLEGRCPTARKRGRCSGSRHREGSALRVPRQNRTAREPVWRQRVLARLPVDAAGER